MKPLRFEKYKKNKKTVNSALHGDNRNQRFYKEFYN